MAVHARTDFGKALRRLRLRAGLSQERLAEAASLSPDGIGALERGTRRAPYRETVDLLAEALGASESEREELHLAARRPRRLPGSADTDAGPGAPTRVPNNLPHAATSLRGRERDLEFVASLSTTHRLVTLVGSGGIGKTRLAVAYARSRGGEEGLDGIWFADLAPLATGDPVTGTIAKAVGVAFSDDPEQPDGFVRDLAKKRGLLILDNCEHVPEAAARAASAILANCPNVSVVATSRRPLAVEGESVYRLPTLAVPGAVELFVDRAAAANRAFVLDDANADTVSDICAKLNGIPLAIEMAAARLNVLSVSSLNDRLTGRLRLLKRSESGTLPRQRTLSALIDWSYDLLSPAERSILNRCAIFAGGFTLDAATEVCADAGQDSFDVLDRLAALVDQSLVIADTLVETERFHLLESTRAYALERLDACGERESTSRRHAEYFARVARAADLSYGSTKTSRWLPALEAETANFRRALEWTLRDGHDPALGGAIAGALERFWINGGFEVEGRNWLRFALDRLDESAEPAIVARLQRARAWLEVAAVKVDAASAAATLYARLGDAQGLGDSLRLQSLGLAQLARYDEAIASNARATEMFRATQDKRNLANCLDLAAAIATQVGDLETARRCFEEALPLFRELGSEGGVGSVLTGLAQLEFVCGNPRRALDLAREAHAIRRVSKYSSNMAIDQVSMALYALALGDLEAAQEHASTALAAGRLVDNEAVTVNALIACGALCVRRNQIERAARLLGYIDTRTQRFTLARDRTEEQLYAELSVPLKAHFDAARLAELTSEGALWSQERAAAEALPAGET